MSKEKEQFIGGKREFLNERLFASLSAMIGYCIKVYTWNQDLVKEGLFDSSEIAFDMSSCFKKLSLDFEIDTKEQMKNSLSKLDTIIDVCQAMKTDLKAARLLVNAGIKRRDELKEAQDKKVREGRR